MIRADRYRCCGSGMCVLICPEVFDQDDSGLVVIDADAVRTADLALLRHAVSCCPGQALSEVDSAGAEKSAANERK
ncbi:ferredoxin [Nonomuraea antimicrobica]|uniref:Ferredoxin n=1 Tax=Nonomuraea antimicrobica TaxID=561173 RepID=A0ABP7DE71_9ACTN